MNIKQITFSRNTTSLGRNGAIITTGMEITHRDFGRGTVVIQPITSRGKVGRCFMELPNEIEEVRAMRKALEAIEMEMEMGASAGQAKAG